MGFIMMCTLDSRGYELIGDCETTGDYIETDLTDYLKNLDYTE